MGFLLRSPGTIALNLTSYVMNPSFLILLSFFVPIIASLVRPGYIGISETEGGSMHGMIFLFPDF